MRAMAALYGCMALIVLGLIVLTKGSSLPPDDASDRRAWPGGLQAERENPGAVSSRKAQ
jgi:hypothetical protein